MTTAPPPRIAAIVVAAGRGVRAGDGIPKQYRPIAGKPAVRHALEAFARHPAISEVLAVIHPDDRDMFAAAASGLQLLPAVSGGPTRQESVLYGLESIAGSTDVVLIHDAARPIVSERVVNALIAALSAADGAVPALTVVDSLRRGSAIVEAEVDRRDLYRVQTPQAFHLPAILAAHRAAAPGATDDVAVALAAGLRIAIVEGDETMAKLTFPQDFARAEAALTSRLISRTASGFDVHRFGPGDKLWLCGICIPHTRGLIGHSDADVGLHALTDALLGTMAAGDIGDHFPPGNPQWRGAASSLFLTHALELVTAHGGVVDHADLTLICEQPKLAPYREQMRHQVASLLQLPVTAVSIKATTTEMLGFTGRSEGIAAQAMATVRLPGNLVRG